MIKSALKRLLFFFAGIFVWLPTSAPAQTNTIPFQAYVASIDGNPLNGVYVPTIRFVDINTGEVVWDEAQAVTITDGSFSIQLGSVDGLPSDFGSLFTRDLRLELILEGDTLASDMSSVPFAMYADQCATADVATTALALASTNVGTGLTVSSSGVLSINSDSIRESHLKVVDSPSDEECLTYESTGGDFEWQSCGSSSSDSWSSTTAPTANMSINQSEFTTLMTWDTGSTAAALDAFTIAVTNDATTDSTEQRLLVIKNNAASGGGTTNVGIAIENADDGTMTSGLVIAGTGTGAITTAIDASDADIGTALAIGSNDITTSSVTLSSTELGYLDGVTSNLQTQLNATVSNAVPDGQIVIGNSSNIGTARVMSGDATLSNTGVLTIAADGVAAAEIAADAVGASEIAATAVTAASYGSATQVGTFTVDADGRLTAAANATITGTAPGGAAGGDLTGTYPNPTVTTDAVALATDTTGSYVATVAAEGGGEITVSGVGAENATATLDVGANTVDFAEFENTLDLDAALTLNQTTNTWTQSFTGTTTDGFSYTAAQLTTGHAFSITTTNTSTSATAEVVAAGVLPTNAQATNSHTSGTYTGFGVEYTLNTGTGITSQDAALRVKLVQNDSASGDTTANSLIALENLDTATGNTITVGDAINISAATASGIGDAIDVSDDEIDVALRVNANSIVGTTGIIDYTNFDVDASGNTTLDDQADLRLSEANANGTEYVAIQAPSLAATYTLTLPVDDGTNGQGLTTDGSGVLSWTTPSTDAPTDAEYIVSAVNGTLTAEDVMTAGSGLTGTNGVGTFTLDVVGGTGITANADDIATASGETGFLASGALTCGASTAGRMQIHTTPLQYCDNAATPALKYAAYGDSDGDATGVECSSCVGSSDIGTDLDFADFQDTLDLDAALTLNQTTNAWTQSFTGSTTTGLAYTADSVSSGVGIDVSVDGLTSGKGLYVISTSTSTSFDTPGAVMKAAHTPNFSADSGQSGMVFAAGRDVIVTSGAVTVSGAVGYFRDEVTSGSPTHNADVVEVEQAYASNSGAALNITTAGTGYGLRVNDNGAFTDTTAFVINDSGAVGIGVDPGSWTDPSVVSLTMASGATSGTAMDVQADSANTGLGLNVSANALTNGQGLKVISSSTVLGTGSMLWVTKTGASGSTAFTGDIVDIDYTQTFNGGTGITHSGSAVDVSRNITLNSNGNTHTLSGALMSLKDAATQTDGTLTHSASVLTVWQSYASNTGPALWVAQEGTGDTVKFEDVLGDTTPFVVDADGDVGIGVSSPSGKLVVLPPATQTIAAGNTITADGCGTIKKIDAASAVTTNTTDTFTAPAAANEGCCMIVYNADAADNITLDVNANFKTAVGTDKTLGPNDAIEVCSTGASGHWFQASAVVDNM